MATAPPLTIPGTFAGSAFDPSLPDGRGAGRISIAGGALRFESGQHHLELPLAGLELRLGGENDAYLFASHPSRPGTTLSTKELAILDHPQITGDPELARQVARMRSKSRRTRVSCGAALLVTLAVVVGLIAGVVLLKDRLVDAVAKRVPPSLETRLGDAVFSQIRASGNLVEDPEVQARVERLVAPLVAAVPEKQYPLRFHVLKDPTVNAFALPGGNMVLHTGLVLRAERPEEVLGVLGHEIAHVTRRHTLRQMVQTAGTFVIVQAVIGDVEGLMAVLTDSGTRLLQLRFSRDFEREADDTGWQYLIDGGIDPRGLITFFEKMRADEQEQLGEAANAMGAMDFLSTHPASDERIERLTAKLRQLESGSERRWKELDVDFTGLQQRLKGL
ncbi:MAG TPA: M48 family metallopeptidase [Thermoanaerobaculia bacterium]|nr:M48 family metallopeptidase [Thermoanaerobaculia bacterium]